MLLLTANHLNGFEQEDSHPSERISAQPFGFKWRGFRSASALFSKEQLEANQVSIQYSTGASVRPAHTNRRSSSAGGHTPRSEEGPHSVALPGR